MEADRYAWVLNLDADLELAALHRYTPTKSVRGAVASFVPILASSLLGPHDILVDEASTPGVARGLSGLAFCPTPRALAILRAAGAEPEKAPRPEILRRVNSRAFASSLGTTLDDAAFVTTFEQAHSKLTRPPHAGNGWRVKRAFGMAGRGQRLIRCPLVTAEDLAFVRAGLAEGGVQVEPNVEVVREYAVHGMLREDGTYRLGRIVEQQCDARGAWRATTPLAPEDETEETFVERLLEEANYVASALRTAHYFGPFGIDAYAYRGPRHEVRFQPRSEINARYSMGFAVGMAPLPRTA